MLAAGFLIVFAGYTVGSWGLCLVKGYDITFREWVDPLHPFQWSTVTQLPDNVILPGGTVKGTPPAQTGGANLGNAVQGAVQGINQAVANGTLG